MTSIADLLGPAWPALLLVHTLKASLLLLAAFGVTALMRRASAAARHFVWTVALAAVLALPALSLALPGWRVAALPAAPAVSALSPTAAPAVEPPGPPAAVASTSGRRTASDTASDAAVREGARAAGAGVGSRARAPGERGGALDWRGALLLLWTLGAAAIVVRLAAGVTAVWWITRRASMMTDAGWLHLAHAIAKRLGMGRGVTLLEGDRRTVPMTWGVLQPVVWLPSGAEAWTEERRAVVLTHELAHVRRRDALTQWVAHLALAANWFNPLAWMAARRFREERERACDDAVLALGTRPEVYADHLLDIVRSLGAAGGPAPAMAMARRSQFEGRLLAILDAAEHRLSISRVGALATVALALAAALPLAAARPVPRALPRLEPRQPAPSSAQSNDGATSKDVADTGDFPLFDHGPVKMSLRAAGEPKTAAGAARAPRAPRAPSQGESRGLLALLREAQAGDTLVRQVIAAAAEMTSDGDKRDVFLAVLRHPSLDQGDLAALLRAAARMASDGDKADVLRAALPRVPDLDPTTRAALFAGITSMTSDGDRREVLFALLPHLAVGDAASRAPFFAAVGKFTSDGDRADVLRAVLERPRLTSGALVDVFRAAAVMTSDGDKSGVLVTAARRHPLDAAARQAYLTAARTMTSDGDRSAALAALLPGGADTMSHTSSVPTPAAPAASAAPSGIPMVSSGNGRLWTTNLELNGENHGVPTHEVRIDATRVRVSPDGEQVEGFESGGSLTVTHTVHAGVDASRTVTRHVEMHGNGRAIRRRYVVDGVERPWDAEAEAWLTDVLRRWGPKPRS